MFHDCGYNPNHARACAYTAISKKVVLQKHKTLNSKRARDDG